MQALRSDKVPTMGCGVEIEMDSAGGLRLGFGGGNQIQFKVVVELRTSYWMGRRMTAVMGAMKHQQLIRGEARGTLSCN